MITTVEDDWALYLDWCAVAGIEPIPVTDASVAAFIEERPGRSSTLRRLQRSLRAMVRTARVPGSLSSPARSSTMRVGEGEQASEWILAGIPNRPFKGGLQGRRDAWIVALIAGLGFSRREAALVSSDEIEVEAGGVVRVRGRAFERASQSSACPRCAAVRWLEIVADVTFSGPLLVKPFLNRAERVDESVHRCDEWLDDTWRQASLLSPSLDKHGHSLGVAMSPTSVSAVMRHRQSIGPRRLADTPRTRRPAQEVDTKALVIQQDEAQMRVDALAAQVEAALEEALGLHNAVSDVSD